MVKIGHELRCFPSLNSSVANIDVTVLWWVASKHGASRNAVVQNTLNAFLRIDTYTAP